MLLLPTTNKILVQRIFMEQKDTTSSFLHPLEESVLSLATGKVDQPQELSETFFKETAEEEPDRPYTLQTDKIHTISENINECMRFVGSKVLGRNETIKQTFIALITGEHQLFISRTGMAKSLLARQIFSCFDGAQVFEKQLTKDTMPENLFGAYDIEAMKKGKMIHNVEGSLVLSHFAFLDEIFDANDMLLRSLLSLLNEKQLVNGEQIVYSTLHSSIAAANYIRVTEILEAVIDRFLYKSYIPENKELFFQYSIDQIYQEQFGKVYVPDKRLTLGELALIKKVIQSKQIEIPGYVLFLKNYAVKRYIEETRSTVSDKKAFTISDRTSVKSQDTLRASAILDGRLNVDEKDLDSLIYILCTIGREDEKTRLNKIIGAAKNYFRQDKALLESCFDAIAVLNIIKASRTNRSLKSDTGFKQVIKRLECFHKKEGSVLKEYFSRLKNTLMGFSKDTFLPETFSLLENISEVALKNAKSKETRELISGFREEVFYEKKLMKI